MSIGRNPDFQEAWRLGPVKTGDWKVLVILNVNTEDFNNEYLWRLKIFSLAWRWRIQICEDDSLWKLFSCNEIFLIVSW